MCWKVPGSISVLFELWFFVFFVFIFNLFFFCNNISSLEKGKPNFTSICNFYFFPLWLYDIYLIKLYISYYLYLIKLAISLASKLCGVVVGEWDYMLRTGFVFFFSLWFFVFFVFILFFQPFRKGKTKLNKYL